MFVRYNIAARIVHGTMLLSNYSMKRRRIPPEFSLVVAIVLVLSTMALTRRPVVEIGLHDGSTQAHPEISEASKCVSTFFPVAVWYSGGRARAPMLETLTPVSSETAVGVMNLKLPNFLAGRGRDWAAV